MTIDGQSTFPLMNRRMQALLTHLLLFPEGPHTRHHLAIRIWSESKGEAQALANLRRLLSSLHKLFPTLAQQIESTRHTIRWAPPMAVQLDVAIFTAAIGEAEEAVVTQDWGRWQAALTRAVTTYLGHLLPDCHDEWILPVRERLREQFLSALDQLISLMESQGNYAAAISYTRCLLHHQPLREATHYHLIRLYLQSGNEVAAQQAYDDCIALLARELKVTPGPALRNLGLQLAQGRTFSVAPRPLDSTGTQPEAPIFREGSATSLVDENNLRRRLASQSPEFSMTSQSANPTTTRRPPAAVPPTQTQSTLAWSQLQHAWRASATGQLQCLLITDAEELHSGQLLQRFYDWVRAEGALVATSQCVATKLHRPYAVMVAWLRTAAFYPHLANLSTFSRAAVAQTLPGLFPDQPTLSPLPAPASSGQLWLVLEALTQIIRAPKQPILLALEEIQWCDTDTLNWFIQLMHRYPQESLLLLVTLRGRERTAPPALKTWLYELRRHARLQEVALVGGGSVTQ